MGKRQIIYSSAQVADNSELVGKEVNLETVARRLWHGRVVSVSRTELELRDARKGRHRLPINEIQNVYCDIVTDY